MTLLITGGLGFIGSHFIKRWLEYREEPIVNLDACTYAGHRDNLQEYEHHPRYDFILGDILNAELLDWIFLNYRPRAVLHCAAQTHVDRSIFSPKIFFETNVLGTQVLLDRAKHYWGSLESDRQHAFRFVHVSTDEVYGALKKEERPFRQGDPYRPTSPYAASKAASDHCVLSYVRTYGFPALVSHCTNNYGSHQYPEKLIPLIVSNALRGQKLPVYGSGAQSRDWIYVLDHVSALHYILEQGPLGETTLVGGGCERRNIEVVHQICTLLDRHRPLEQGRYADLIEHVPDRLGHDERYALETSAWLRKLWSPSYTFDEGLEHTIQYYIDVFEREKIYEACV